MCGIVGVVGAADAPAILVEGLRRLEYRGYDSAGIAVLDEAGGIGRRRAEGRIARLDALLSEQPMTGHIGIGHTRWATHGAPTEANAHPHATARVAAVHNGIIENYRELRAELQAAGRVFASQTDTEVIPQLITALIEQGLSPVDAVKAALVRFEGAFALGLVFAGEQDLLIGARRGSPLAVGHGDGCMYLGSDAMALVPFTREITYLDEGDMVVLTRAAMTIYDATGAEVVRPRRQTELSSGAVGKGGHRHFMLKEIYEQPAVIGDSLRTFLDPARGTIEMKEMPFDPGRLTRMLIVACGTSAYAGMVAKYWIEQLARLPVDVDVASEFRYRDTPLTAGEVAVFISQSGETADTLAAMRHARAGGVVTIAVVNVPESSMAREADLVLRTKAGPEIGVASTKAFTCQLVTLVCLAISLGRARGTIDTARDQKLTQAIAEVPSRVADVLNNDGRMRSIAESLVHVTGVLYVGRGTAFPIALEGALKFKEISYIHAEAYAAGELKHGPIALIDDGLPVVALAPSGPLFDKTASNIEEIVARRGRVILITDEAGAARLSDLVAEVVVLPTVDPVVAPLLYALPVQLLAYHTAVLKGTDVDQPRNLAKSVTVE
ncbi:glutamine--fructose-6-phosphate aminotransferase [isomerizing] [Tistrella bauzanensis]|uniref:Glutamine--fructose-6-phosphate aminotransferase [isomerizing] n=1 Tax=Tistrella bauzanensis TaxID=657419 RepID=A0ABQ1IPF3_9PROT|nr:glutamine--fructose-6-phosphate transaminase (isomerizing) [Tistrella bauzanensis]GGB49264.1 glutamine--fructose-6-phosphate aminotransferase [isomerizing] [Tistrella bauzanensis]